MLLMGGYLPSPAHEVGLGALRGLELTAGPLPDETMEPLPSALQQSFQDCVAHAIAVAIAHGQWSLLGRPIGLSSAAPAWPELPSRAFVYAVARGRADQSIDVDAGTFIHSALEGIAALGFPTESQWAYGPEHLKTPPDWAALRLAADQKLVKGARRIVSTGYQRVQDVAVAIAGGSVVAWGTVLDAAFQSLTAADVWPGARGDDIGGHAMVLHGFRRRASGRLEFASRSSWGPGWSDNGSGWVLEDAIGSPKAEDFWIVETAPTNSGTT